MMVKTDELVFLFRGDDESFGYAHAELVVEMCSQANRDVIPTVEWCSQLIYPEEGFQIPFSALEVVRSGVKLWYHRNRPRH